MATNCAIAVEHKPGRFIVNTCNFDGYLEGVGLELYVHFDGLKSALALVKGREIRTIYNGKVERYPELNYRLVIPQKGYEAEEIYDVFGASYTYVFTKGEWWWCKSNNHRTLTRLEPFVKMLVQRELDL